MGPRGHALRLRAGPSDTPLCYYTPRISLVDSKRSYLHVPMVPATVVYPCCRDVRAMGYCGLGILGVWVYRVLPQAPVYALPRTSRPRSPTGPALGAFPGECLGGVPGVRSGGHNEGRCAEGPGGAWSACPCPITRPGTNKGEIPGN